MISQHTIDKLKEKGILILHEGGGVYSIVRYKEALNQNNDNPILPENIQE